MIARRSRWISGAAALAVLGAFCGFSPGWRVAEHESPAGRVGGSESSWWADGAALKRGVVAVSAAEMPTTLRLVDASGAPASGVPVYDAAESQGMGGGEPLGVSDAEGRLIPEQFPIEVDLGEWPALPRSLSLVDDHDRAIPQPERMF